MDFSDLLPSYDKDCRVICERISKKSLDNMRTHALIIYDALGLPSGKSNEEKVRLMDQYINLVDIIEGGTKSNEPKTALKVLNVEFCDSGARVGWYYGVDVANCRAGLITYVARSFRPAAR